MGNVEKINDLSPNEEAAFKAAELSLETSTQSHLRFYRHLAWARTLGQQDHRRSLFPELDSCPTAELLKIGRGLFGIYNPYLTDRYREGLVVNHGRCPEDESRFTWWFAAFVALSNHARYRLFGQQACGSD